MRLKTFKKLMKKGLSDATGFEWEITSNLMVDNLVFTIDKGGNPTINIIKPESGYETLISNIADDYLKKFCEMNQGVLDTPTTTPVSADEEEDVDVETVDVTKTTQYSSKIRYKTPTTECSYCAIERPINIDIRILESLKPLVSKFKNEFYVVLCGNGDILDYIYVPKQESTTSNVTIHDDDDKKINEFKAKYEQVGLFHSHPMGGHFLSSQDYESAFNFDFQISCNPSGETKAVRRIKLPCGEIRIVECDVVGIIHGSIEDQIEKQIKEKTVEDKTSYLFGTTKNGTTYYPPYNGYDNYIHRQASRQGFLNSDY